MGSIISLQSAADVEKSMKLTACQNNLKTSPYTRSVGWLSAEKSITKRSEMHEQNKRYRQSKLHAIPENSLL